MRAFLKKYGSILYIALMSAAVVLFFALSGDLKEIGEALAGMDPVWLCAAAGCMLLYISLRTAVLVYYLRRRGHRIGARKAFGVSGAGFFYSAITPSASGGQPAQVLRLVRGGVPAGTATAAISIEFIGFQVGFLLLGAAAWIFGHGYLSARIAGFGWLVILGYALNAGTIALIVLAAASPKALSRLLSGLFHIGAKLRWVKDEEKAIAKVTRTLEEYRSAMFSLLEHIADLLAVLALSLAEVTAYMLVPYCVYRAFALSGSTVFQVTGTELMLFIASAFIPLPGAAGASESGFCLFFRGIFTQETVVPAMFAWRFLTYYFTLIVGFALMSLDDLTRNIK